jgi:hypothetical protein
VNPEFYAGTHGGYQGTSFSLAERKKESIFNVYEAKNILWDRLFLYLTLTFVFGRFPVKFTKKSIKKQIPEKWVRALTDVTGINGFVLEHCNGDEGKLVGQVVERVLNMLKDHLDYDVFINHRGPDVKKTLASHLYHGLVERGLRVFLDIEEMHEGDSLTSQIEGAIRTAFVHIAIFSDTYAKSRWCLDELVLMLESGRIIIPVFHNVKPSELTLKNGKYDEHLRELEKEIDEGKPRYDPATIGEWKKALSDVDKYTAFGFDLEQFDGDEGQLADEVIQRVLSEEVKVWKDGRHLR